MNDSIADGFTCIVCFNIFANPVITDCGHTYCHQCIQKSIQSGSNDCPKCRKTFRGREGIGSANNDNTVTVEHNQQIYVFVRNLTVNAIISQFKIRCDYEWNGCRATVELGLFESHLRNCEHRICRTCGLTSNDDEHDCLDLLKNGVNEWRIKCKQFELSFNEMRDKYMELEEQNCNNERLRDEWKVKCCRYGKKVDLLKEKYSQSEARNKHSTEMINEWKQKCMSIYENLKLENTKLKQERKSHLIEISESKDKYDDCSTKFAELDRKFEELQRKHQVVFEANHELKQHCVNLERTLYQLVSQISFLESENHKLVQQSNGLTQKKTDLEKTNKDLRLKIYDLEARIQEMTFSVQTEEQVVSKSRDYSQSEVVSNARPDAVCKTCCLSIASVEEHNCLKQLTKEAIRWKNKYEESENTLAKVRDKYANVVKDNLINIKESYRWRDKCENFERMAKELKKDMSNVEDKLRVCSMNFVNKEMNKWRQKCNQFEDNLTKIDKKYSKHYHSNQDDNFEPAMSSSDSCGMVTIDNDVESKTDKITNTKLINEKDVSEESVEIKEINKKDLTETIKIEIPKDVVKTKSEQMNIDFNAKQSLMYTENVNYVIFGTFRTKCSNFHINCNGILLKGVTPKASHDMSTKDVIIPFQSMKELRFCSKLFTMALLIKATDVCTLDIQRLLHLGLPSRQAQTSKHCSYGKQQNSNPNSYYISYY